MRYEFSFDFFITSDNEIIATKSGLIEMEI